jgi:hypothetical protein
LLKDLASHRETIDKLSQQLTDLQVCGWPQLLAKRFSYPKLHDCYKQDTKVLGDASFQSKLEEKVKEGERMRDQLQQQVWPLNRCIGSQTLLPPLNLTQTNAQLQKVSKIAVFHSMHTHVHVRMHSRMLGHDGAAGSARSHTGEP